MADHLESQFKVTLDDLRQYAWQALIEDHPIKQCGNFMAVFDTASAEHESAGDDRGKRVFSFLSAIASCCGDYDTKGNPYGPRLQLVDGRRTFIPEDLTDSDLATLKEIVGEIADPEFQARIGDILWICSKDYKAAQLAIRAFLESAQRLEDHKEFLFCVERFKRALQLSAALGPRKPLHQEVVAEVEAAIARYQCGP